MNSWGFFSLKFSAITTSSCHLMTHIHKMYFNTCKRVIICIFYIYIHARALRHRYTDIQFLFYSWLVAGNENNSFLKDLTFSGQVNCWSWFPKIVTRILILCERYDWPIIRHWKDCCANSSVLKSRGLGMKRTSSWNKSSSG